MDKFIAKDGTMHREACAFWQASTTNTGMFHQLNMGRQQEWCGDLLIWHAGVCAKILFTPHCGFYACAGRAHGCSVFIISRQPSMVMGCWQKLCWDLACWDFPHSMGSMGAQAGRTIAAFPSLGSRGSASSERSLGRSESSGDGDADEEGGDLPGGSSSGGVTHSSCGAPEPAASGYPGGASAAAAPLTLSPRKRSGSGRHGPGLGARRGSAEQSSCAGARHPASGSLPEWNEGEQD